MINWEGCGKKQPWTIYSKVSFQNLVEGFEKSHEIPVIIPGFQLAFKWVPSVPTFV
jgi:hypothetical protein